MGNSFHVHISTTNKIFYIFCSKNWQKATRAVWLPNWQTAVIVFQQREMGEFQVNLASFSPYSFIPERSKDVFILSYSLNDKSTHTQPSPSQCKSRTTTRNNQNHFTTHTCFQTRRVCYTFLPLWSTSWQNWSINLKEILLLNMLNSSSTFNWPGSYRGFHGLGFSLFISWVVN